MPTTIRRTSFCLTKEANKQLIYLSEEFEENKSQVINRAIQLLFNLYKQEEKLKSGLD
jgi:hypothetical protein